MTTGNGSVSRPCAGLQVSQEPDRQAIDLGGTLLLNPLRHMMGSMVSLTDIVDALEFRSDEHTMYLDRETGDLCPISGYVVRIVQRGDPADKLPEWQRPEYDWARLLLETDRMVALPAQFDINEWEIIADFVQSVEDAGVREKLFHAIHGKGAFSLFRDVVQRLGIEDDWFKFREEAFREIAMEWCEEHKIPYDNK